MKGKKPAYILLVIILILSIVFVNLGADPQPTKLFIDPPTYKGALLGEVFTININISNVQDLCGFEFKLGYNTTLLDALENECAIGPFPPRPISWSKIEKNETEGYVFVSAYWTRAAEGNGTLATIAFNVTYSLPASCTLDLYETHLLNSAGGSFIPDADDGNYQFVILTITVATNKSWYYFGENVEIYGNLTLNGSPYHGLVALEVDSSLHAIVMRTLQTDNATPPGDISIIDVIPCNSMGDPKENFTRGSFAYFTPILYNSGTEPKEVTISMNAYDKDMVPLPFVQCTKVTINPGVWGPNLWIAPITIPSWASVGKGTVYASAFTNYPNVGGIPLCPEKSHTFNIEGTAIGTGSQVTQPSDYNLTFRLPSRTFRGNYTVYASSSYRGQQKIVNTIFEAKLLGDVNGDGKVTGLDQAIVGIYLWTVYGQPGFNPAADMNRDGKVTGIDQGIVGIHLWETSL